MGQTWVKYGSNVDHTCGPNVVKCGSNVGQMSFRRRTTPQRAARRHPAGGAGAARTRAGCSQAVGNPGFAGQLRAGVRRGLPPHRPGHPLVLGSFPWSGPIPWVADLLPGGRGGSAHPDTKSGWGICQPGTPTEASRSGSGQPCCHKAFGITGATSRTVLSSRAGPAQRRRTRTSPSRGHLMTSRTLPAQRSAN